VHGQAVSKNLLNYHIVHHCKEPDTCFGSSTTWWDRVFGTTPHKTKGISERILAFYYKKEKKTNGGRNPSTNDFVL